MANLQWKTVIAFTRIEKILIIYHQSNTIIFPIIFMVILERPMYISKKYVYIYSSYLMLKCFCCLEVMFNLITRYPSQRMSAAEFQTSKYFDNVLVSTVKFFESFPEKTADDKANFMKGLIRILPQFPERVLVRKVNTLNHFIVFIISLEKDNNLGFN